MAASEIRSAVLNGKRPEVPMSAPKALSDIAAACWAQDASARPSFEKVLDILKDAAAKL